MSRAAPARPGRLHAHMTPLLTFAAVVACGLAAYLVVAMLAPERFS